MIETRTCLVLGAGASAPYGFPVGAALKRKIISELGKPNSPLWKLVVEHGGQDRNEVQAFVSAFRGSFQESVDAFLSHRLDHLDVGKLAIAAALVECENLDSLFDAGEDNWYQYLWRSLQSEGRDEFPHNRLSVVTFNYDRSLEAFLSNAYANSFNTSTGKAWEVVREAIPIIHVHGSLGELTFGPPTEAARPYQGKASWQDVVTAASGLQVLSEADQTSKAFRQACDQLSSAKQVVFLGCAYHEPNMERLGLDEIFKLDDRHWPRFVGTAFGLGAAERRRAKERWKVTPGEAGWKNQTVLRELVDL